MIRPRPGVAFTDAGDGDVKGDPEARRSVSAELGISPEWASVHQQHGAAVLAVDRPGPAGAADALYTSTPGLPLAVFGADCLVLVVGGTGGIGVAHGGWRGLAGGVVTALLGAMTAAGLDPRWAALGPAAGPCCYEVGAEVALRFPARTQRTSGGTTFLDLVGAAQAQLEGLSVWSWDRCTLHEVDLFSHRREHTERRQAGLGWLG
jgi:hypothetical protein